MGSPTKLGDGTWQWGGKEKMRIVAGGHLQSRRHTRAGSLSWVLVARVSSGRAGSFCSLPPYVCLPYLFVYVRCVYSGVARTWPGHVHSSWGGDKVMGTGAWRHGGGRCLWKLGVGEFHRWVAYLFFRLVCPILEQWMRVWVVGGTLKEWIMGEEGRGGCRLGLWK